MSSKQKKKRRGERGSINNIQNEEREIKAGHAKQKFLSDLNLTLINFKFLMDKQIFETTKRELKEIENMNNSTAG